MKTKIVAITKPIVGDGEMSASDFMVDPKWNLDLVEYRIKPTAKLRAWTADEVPLGAWLREKQGNEQLILKTSAPKFWTRSSRLTTNSKPDRFPVRATIRNAVN